MCVDWGIDVVVVFGFVQYDVVQLFVYVMQVLEFKVDVVYYFKD